MSSLIFFASSSARSRFSRSRADSFGGGRRAAAMGSESERFLTVELMWEMNVAVRTRGALGGGRRDRNAEEVKEVSMTFEPPFRYRQNASDLVVTRRKINHIRVSKLYVCNPTSAIYSPYPPGFFCCQFQRSLHIVSRSCDALNPSSASANAGSAVRSGTSPRLGACCQHPRSKPRRPCSPSLNNLISVVKPCGLPHGLHYLQHAHPFPLSKVVRLVPRGVWTVVEYLGIRGEGFQREKVALGEVDDV